jgi:hypothetical protein
VLLYPFKEEFYFPSIFVKQSNVFWSKVKVIGDKNESLLSLLVIIPYPAKGDRVSLQ